MVLYDNNIEKKIFPGTEELLDTLKSVFALRSAVYIILDGLDEYGQQDRARRELLELIFSDFILAAPSVRLMVRFSVLHRPLRMCSKNETHFWKSRPHQGMSKLYIANKFDDFRAPLDDQLKRKVEEILLLARPTACKKLLNLFSQLFSHGSQGFFSFDSL